MEREVKTEEGLTHNEPSVEKYHWEGESKQPSNGMAPPPRVPTMLAKHSAAASLRQAVSAIMARLALGTKPSLVAGVLLPPLLSLGTPFALVMWLGCQGFCFIASTLYFIQATWYLVEKQTNRTFLSHSSICQWGIVLERHLKACNTTTKQNPLRLWFWWSSRDLDMYPGRCSVEGPSPHNTLGETIPWFSMAPFSQLFCSTDWPIQYWKASGSHGQLLSPSS